jgi:transcription antitermination protein NusB
MKHTRPDGVDPAARSRARRRALQAIYAWQMSGQPIAQVIEQFRHEQDMEVADLDYFEDLVRGIERNREHIDTELRVFLDREIAQVDPVERGVLRIATYEMLYRADIPYRVVINEAIETTKRFGADHGHSFINGVLDKAAGTWRAAEVAEGRRR